MKPWMFILIGIVCIALIGYFAYISIVYYKMFIRMKKEKLLLDVENLSETHYKPYIDLVYSSMKEFMAIPYEEVSIQSFDKKKLVGKYYSNNSNKTIIYFHGYHADPYNTASVPGLKILASGYNLLVITERAHGASEGKHITFGVKEQRDALMWIDFVRKTYNPESIGLWGVSMGCGVVEMISSRVPEVVKAMVLDCGFTGAYNEVKHVLTRKFGFTPYFLLFGLCIYTRVFGHFKLEKDKAKESLRNTRVPAFFIHGKEDTMVPYSMGIENYEACSSYKEFLEAPCGHAIASLASKKEIEDRVYPFLEKYL